MKTLLALTTAIGMAASSALAQTAEKHDASIHRPSEINWQPGPAALPAGAKMAALEGDPTWRPPMGIFGPETLPIGFGSN